jgi:carbon starvation protein CstA
MIIVVIALIAVLLYAHLLLRMSWPLSFASAVIFVPAWYLLAYTLLVTHQHQQTYYSEQQAQSSIQSLTTTALVLTIVIGLLIPIVVKAIASSLRQNKPKKAATSKQEPPSEPDYTTIREGVPYEPWRGKTVL